MKSVNESTTHEPTHAAGWPPSGPCVLDFPSSESPKLEVHVHRIVQAGGTQLLEVSDATDLPRFWINLAHVRQIWAGTLESNGYSRSNEN